MKSHYIFLFGTVWLWQLGLAQPVGAVGSQDVCCYGLGEGNAPFALPQPASSCQSGQTDSHGGRRICGSSNDLDGCANKSAKEVCTACGKHWIAELGGICSDKSIKDLAKEQEKKEKPTTAETTSK